MTTIHPTALISASAKLGENVTIGAYSIIEDNVTIGDNTSIRNHCVIGARTTIGSGNNIYNSVVIGVEPQDLKHRGEETRTIVGNNNIIREFVTINNGTGEGGLTQVGNDNALLSYSHIAHDNIFGNGIILSNVVQLAGHVIIEDNVVIGGCTAVHQFCKVGKNAMVAAGIIVAQDVPPFSLIDRKHTFHHINTIGLTRKGFSKEVLKELSTFYNIVFKSGYNNSDGIKHYITERTEILPEVQYCIDFINNSNRGVIR